jgi:hypothetical protein
VAVGDGGAIIVSGDGLQWTLVSPITAVNLSGVACTGGATFVAVGDGGTLLEADDAGDWKLVNVGANDDFHQIAYGDVQGIGVSGGLAGGVMVWSTDGTHFVRQLSQTADFYGIAFGNHLFVAVGYGGTIVTTPSLNPQLSAFEVWAQSHGLSGANAAAGADPDHDGLVNLVEFAFGQDPLVASRAAVPTAAVTNGCLTITFRERVGGSGTVGVDYTADGVRYTVEVSADFSPGSWQSGSTLVELVAGSRSPRGDGTENVTVRLKAPISFGPMKFARLRLTPVSSP